MTELKPCPFCGGEAELHPTYDIETSKVDGWFVWCNNKECECIPETNNYFTKAEAIDAWNTRAAIEFDNWFYLPKPKEPIAEVTETAHAWDGTKVKTDVFYQVREQAIVNWAKELDEHIIKRICEVWNQERTCKWEYPQGINGWNGYTVCSSCGEKYDECVTDTANYCPNCGAKVVEE